MELMHDVPVLRSLAAHAVHRCGQCGHILLVADDDAGDWRVGWLQVSTEWPGAITGVSLA
jgi:hypothetical protein